MKLAIDFVGTYKESGTKTYNLNFLKKIKYFKSKNKIYIFLTKNYENYVKLKENKNLHLVVLPNFLSNSFIRIIWMQFVLPIQLLFFKVDILFSPMNIAPLTLSLIRIKSVLAVHTNLPWINLNLLPGNYIRNLFMKKLMEKSITNSVKIITCSNYSKKELIKNLNLNKNKITTVYLGVNKKYENHKKLNIKKKYILSVISCTRYHGILEMIKAFKDFKEKVKLPVKLILVMSILDHNFYKEVEKFISNKFKKGEIKIIKNLESRFLPKLYKKSSLYIFSSLSEVFGFTTLEALQNKTRVVCSKTSALEEINQNYVEYYKYGDYLDLSKKIKKNFGKKNLKNTKFLLKKYNWNLTFNRTIKNIYNV